MMNRFIGFLPFLYLMVKLGCLGMTILDPKIMNDVVEPNPLNMRGPSPAIVIVRMNNPEEEDLHQVLSSTDLKAPRVDDLEEDGGGFKEFNPTWEQPAKSRNPHIQVWRIHNSRPNSHKKLLLGRHHVWPAHRALPSICLAGPSLFQKCCTRLGELANETAAVQKFCLFGKCCGNLNKTLNIAAAIAVTASPVAPQAATDGNTMTAAAAAVTTAPPALLTTMPAALVKGSSKENQATLKTTGNQSSTTFRQTPLIAEKRLRPSEGKVSASKGSAEYSAKVSSKTNGSKEAGSAEVVNKPGESEEGTIVAEAASSGKLHKMSGKGKNSLSREETEAEKEKEKEKSEKAAAAAAAAASIESVSDEDEADETSKGSEEAAPKTGSSPRNNEEEQEENATKEKVAAMATTTRTPPLESGKLTGKSDEADYSDMDDQEITADDGKSSEPTQADDESSKPNTNAASVDDDSDEKWTKNVKPYRPPMPNKNVTPKKMMPTTAIGSSPSTFVSGAVSKRTVPGTQRETSSAAPPVSSAGRSAVTTAIKDTRSTAIPVSPSPKLKPDLNAQVVKGSCARNRGGPNCTIDITGAITGYGYYVYVSGKLLTRAESVRECGTRNMTLAFLTNHNEDKLLRRVVNGNSSYWIGLSKNQQNGNMAKNRYHWDDGSDAGTYITRYVTVALDGDAPKKDDASLTTCILKLLNGKMKVDCVTGQPQMTAFPLCMYRPPIPVHPTNVTAVIEN